MGIRLSTLFLLLISSPAFAVEPIKLTAGPLSMIFEPDNALLRYVRIGEHNILQGINAPIRDEYWGTVSPEVKNLELAQEDASFDLTFDVRCHRGDIQFDWHGHIIGSQDGKVSFSFEGKAGTTFLRNRIGFCILHGPEAAGRACTIETTDGQSVQGRFPSFIAPHQPFKNIRSITHEVSDGVWAQVQMEGDTFEMEDQRNWTDASFKTYCTPLELPYPVRIEKGTTINHKIEISLDGVENLPRPSQLATSAVVLRVSQDADARKPLPAIGVQVSSQIETLTDTQRTRLQRLNLNHLRVTITPAQQDADAQLRRAAQQARQLGVKLHVGMVLGETPAQELQRIASTIGSIPQPTDWLLLAGNDEKLDALRAFLSRLGQRGRVGRGEDTNFTELNRTRPDPQQIDVASFGVNPQVHAFDNTSMVETLAIQGDTVRTARQFLGSLPLQIAPITLRKQLVSEPPPPGELPTNVDPRQPSLFTAGWTAGSIKYLAEAGVESVTYFETLGWLGLIEAEAGTPLPERFPSRPGAVFPVFHVIRALAPFTGGSVRKTDSTAIMSVIGLTVELDRRQRVLLINLTPIQQAAHVEGFGGSATVRRIDASRDAVVGQVVKARDDGTLVIELPAHGIAICDRQS